MCGHGRAALRTQNKIYDKKDIYSVIRTFCILESTAENFDVLIIPAIPSSLFFMPLDITEIYFSLSISGQVNECRDIEMGLNFP